VDEKMTTAITLAQAQAQLDALMTSQSGNTLTVRFGDRSVTYRTAEEMTSQINYWARLVTELRRTAMGASRHGYAVADFRSSR
jgi:hypothetical protein